VNTTPDLKLVGVALVDGRPLACADCDNTFSLEVHKRGPFETGPAWVCCLACGHGGEDQAVTNGLVDAVLDGWAQRQKSADRDQFIAEWRGTVLEGELYPTLDVYQAAGAAKAVYEGAQPHVKRWLRGKKRSAKAVVKAPLRLAKTKAGEASASVKVAAVGAAWDLQTGGAGLPGKPSRMGRCRVKGCRKGWVTITTRVHSTTGKKQQQRIRCAVCDRAD